MNQLIGFKLHPHEKIDEVIFHHPIIILPHLVVSVLILLLDFFMMYYLFLQGWWGVALFGAVIVLVAFYVLRLIFLYRRNYFVLTNERIIDFEQVGFFERFINEYHYQKLREVKALVKGLGPTLFRYGDLKLFFIADVGALELYCVGQPRRLQDKINEQLRSGGQETAKATESADPLALIMAQIRLLSSSEREELKRRLSLTNDERGNFIR